MLRVAAGVAIVLLVMLLLVLLVPMAILGMLYIAFRSLFAGLGGQRPEPSAPAHQPIPEEDGEGRENVRVRRTEND